MRELKTIKVWRIPIKAIPLLILFAVILAPLSKAQQKDDFVIQEVLSRSVLSPDGSGGISPVDIIDFNGLAVIFGYQPYILVSDGTAEGTVDIHFPDWAELRRKQSEIIGDLVYNDKLYFTVRMDDANSRDEELWVTDGTQEGTEVVANRALSGISSIEKVYRLNDKLILRAFDDNNSEWTLFMVDMADNSVNEIAGLNTLGNVSGATGNPVMGSYFYFVEVDEAGERLLQRLDENGNKELVYISHKNTNTGFGHIDRLAGSNQTNKLYFESVESDTPQNVLWVYDDDTETTTKLASSKKGNTNRHIDATNPTIAGDYMYFYSKKWDDDFNNGRGGFGKAYLYITDGTYEGTRRAFDADAEEIDANGDINKAYMVAIGDNLIFNGKDETDRTEYLYVTDPNENVEKIEVVGEDPIVYNSNAVVHTVENDAWIYMHQNILHFEGDTRNITKIDTEHLHDSPVNDQAAGIVNGNFWIGAVNEHYYSNYNYQAYSVWQVMRENEWTYPAIPQLKLPADKEEDVAQNPELSWSSVANVDGYRLQISKSSLFTEEGTVLDESSVQISSFEVDTELDYQQKYYWRVQAHNQNGTGEWSISKSFTTKEKSEDDPEVPEIPTLNTPGDNTELNVQKGFLSHYFSWSNIREADLYHLQIADDTDFENTIVDLTLDKFDTRIDYDLMEEETEYYWRVRAKNEAGYSDWSEVFSFYYPNQDPVSAEKENRPIEFALHQNYPNPFNPTTRITYDIKEATNVKLTVYNVLGQEVITLVNERKSAGRYNINFDAGNLTSGMYMYRIEAGDFVKTKSFMLIK